MSVVMSRLLAVFLFLGAVLHCVAAEADVPAPAGAQAYIFGNPVNVGSVLGCYVMITFTLPNAQGDVIPSTAGAQPLYSFEAADFLEGGSDPFTYSGWYTYSGTSFSWSGLYPDPGSPGTYIVWGFVGLGNHSFKMETRQNYPLPADTVPGPFYSTWSAISNSASCVLPQPAPPPGGGGKTGDRCLSDADCAPGYRCMNLTTVGGSCQPVQ